TLAAGGVPVTAPETDLRADVDALLAKVTDRTRIVFLANPNNPTGTYLPSSEVRRLHAGLRPDILLVLDAAYAEFVRRNDYEAGIEMVATSENVVMTRTFSKLYGLAGLRVGWAYCPAGVADVLNRVRGPFNVNLAAQAAAAAALADAAWAEKVATDTIRLRAEATERLTALGLAVTPSEGNFILVHFPEAAGRTAQDADAFLQKEGVIVRRMEGYGLPAALRISIGTEDETRACLESLTAFVESWGG
ncbi:MAG: aminotransferase class I/II-fold pyridoxal phosphate-dependent enzyme, partial [Alphaproteobacteria bacterium]|nr:aminotransferase class I/II-fold pyridoxal phosphate-dependent enzyme [Alphaproteobacteria bacterium]MDX5368271.1 aminotransferase class I/II-fold pyridoxal phosphate-dependent enzyme [Alphaproteobacteria bacterium]MDX5463077.1 aminotransferase class I/II-fold pyridoxal phosphate-dependent enzyme [Alphaproteobacteria bacterium]